jgi:IPT/TIG domain
MTDTAGPVEEEVEVIEVVDEEPDLQPIANPEGTDQYGRPKGLPIEDPGHAPEHWTDLSVASVEPALGAVEGGQAVTVHGSGFPEPVDEASPALALAFGQVAEGDDEPTWADATDLTWVDDRTLTVTTPAGADGPADVRVTVTPANYTPPPEGEEPEEGAPVPEEAVLEDGFTYGMGPVGEPPEATVPPETEAQTPLEQAGTQPTTSPTTTAESGASVAQDESLSIDPG